MLFSLLLKMLLTAIPWIFVGPLSFSAAQAQVSTSSSAQTHPSNHFGSCTEFHQDDELRGIVTFVAPIVCSTQTTVHVKGDVTLQSLSPIKTVGLIIIVHSEGTLTIKAPGRAQFERISNTSADKHVSALSVHGRLLFESPHSPPSSTGLGPLAQQIQDAKPDLPLPGVSDAPAVDPPARRRSNDDLTAEEAASLLAIAAFTTAAVTSTTAASRVGNSGKTSTPSAPASLLAVTTASATSGAGPHGDTPPTGANDSEAPSVAASSANTAAHAAKIIAAADLSYFAASPSAIAAAIDAAAATATAGTPAGGTADTSTAAVPPAATTAAGETGSSIATPAAITTVAPIGGRTASPTAPATPAAAPTAATTAVSTGSANPPAEDLPASWGQKTYTFDNGMVRSCRDIPLSAKFRGGILTIPTSIDCSRPTAITITGDTIVRSGSHLSTTGVLWFIRPGVKVTFSSKTVTLARNKESRNLGHGALFVEGEVEFKTTGWSSSHLEGSPDDTHDIIWVDGEGKFSSDQVIHYTPDAVIVADPAAADKTDGYELAGSIVPADPHLQKTPSDRQADIERHADESSSSSSGDNNIISDSNNNDRGIKYPSARDSAPPAGMWQPQGSSSMETIDVDALLKSILNSPLPGLHGGNVKSLNDFSEKRAPCSSPASTGGSSDRASGGSSSGGSSSDKDGIVDVLHPGPSLKVGEVMTGVLVSPGVPKMVVVDMDGSVMFADVSDDDDKITTLLQADTRKMARVKRMRAEILAEAKRKAREGEKGTKGFAKLRSWLPFGKNGRRVTRAREHAKKHRGQITMSISAKGVLETTVDGTTVLRKGGPWWSRFRTSDSSHQVWVTADGLEVTRKGKRVWGVLARK